MYNYSKNSVSINAEVMATISNFEEVARTLATESVEHTTAKKELSDSLEKLIKDEKIEDAKDVQKQLEELEDAWTIRRKTLDFALYGGKDKDGKKVDGICSIVTNDLYKAYVSYVKDGKSGTYRDEVKTFCMGLINEETIKDGAFNHLYNDILATMSSVRYNSNSQIAQGSAFITTINKRTYKKMLLGAIVDIVSNNKTLKVKKAKADK